MADDEVKDVVGTEDDTPDEGFLGAFAEAAEDKPTDEKAEVKGEEEKPEEKSEEKPQEKSEKPEEKAESPESLEQKFKTLQGMFNQQKEELDKLKASPPAETKKEEAAPPDFSLLFENLTEGLSEEIKSEIAEYDEEYDHIAKYEGIKREQLAKRLIGVMNEAFAQFSEQLKPYLQVTKETAQSTHYIALKEAHPDFEDIRDDVKAWIAEKPKFLKEPLMKVFKEGDTDDVIGLFKQYKDETGYKPEDKKPDKKKEKTQEKEKALELVKTRQKGIAPAPQKASSGGAGDSDEFSNAFAEAANK